MARVVPLRYQRGDSDCRHWNTHREQDPESEPGFGLFQLNVISFFALQRIGVKRFRGGLVFKAHRLLYHSTLGLRVIKKKKKDRLARETYFWRV